MKKHFYGTFWSHIFSLSIILLIAITFSGCGGSGSSGGGGGDDNWGGWVCTKIEIDSDNNGTIDTVVYNTYDAYGNMTKEEWNWDNDDTFNEVDYYTYNANGNMTKEEWDEDNNGTIDVVGYCTYNSNGNITKEKWDWDNNGTTDEIWYYTWEQIDVVTPPIIIDNTYGWTKCMSDSYGRDITTDPSGNVYVTGTFYGTVDFRADFGGGTDIKTSAGGADIFVTRIDADGTYGRTKRMGGSDYDYADGITTDLSGNVYVTGAFFYGTVDFRADWGGTDPKTAEVHDMFITKILP